MTNYCSACLIDQNFKGCFAVYCSVCWQITPPEPTSQRQPSPPDPKSFSLGHTCNFCVFWSFREWTWTPARSLTMDQQTPTWPTTIRYCVSKKVNSSSKATSDSQYGVVFRSSYEGEPLLVFCKLLKQKMCWLEKERIAQNAKLISLSLSLFLSLFLSLSLYIYVYLWLFPCIQGIFLEGLTNHSLPVLFLKKVETSLHAPISLFRPGLVHSGSVSWDDCVQTFCEI